MKNYLFLTITIILFLVGCSDKPNPTGIKILPKEDFVLTKIDTIYATEDSTYFQSSTSESRGTMMIGKYGQTLSCPQLYTVWSGMIFEYMPDSIYEATSIDTVTITLKQSTYALDTISSALYNITLHNGIKKWKDSTLDYTKLTTENYFDASPMNIQATKDSTNTYTITIYDTAAVRNWFKDSLNCGMFFSPQNMNVIKSFYGFDGTNNPKLTVKYTKNGKNNTSEFNYGTVKYFSKVDNLTLNPDKIYIQNGIFYTSNLRFDSISTPYPAQYKRAVIQITLDSASSSLKFQNFTYNNMLFFPVGTGDITEDIINGKTSTMYRNGNGERVYQADITNLFPGIVTKRYDRKFNIDAAYRFTNFDLFAFYGINSSNLRKPKIIVTYSIHQ